MNYQEALDNCIFKYLSGSHCYGTNTEDSDKDYRGVFIAPLNSAFELFNTSFVGRGSIKQQLTTAIDNLNAGDFQSCKFQLETILNETDAGDLNLSVGTVKNPSEDDELQELRKFLKLAADCNPNIIEFLYVEKGIIITSEIWEKIRANRHLFLSKKARFTFSGYALAQLRRIKNHRGYLLNPKEKPNRKDYGLPEETVIPTEYMRAIISLKIDWIKDSIRDVVLAEQRYNNDLKDYKAYEKWKVERNLKRKEMESKFGFDLKHAMHLCRLIRMSKEILKDGIVEVHRHDADELKAIRNGELKYDELINMTENIDKELDDLYKTSKLPNSANHKSISELYKEICRDYYKIKF
jgi:hypothetical protein